jgi:hypothetical protein
MTTGYLSGTQFINLNLCHRQRQDSSIHIKTNYAFCLNQTEKWSSSAFAPWLLNEICGK